MPRGRLLIALLLIASWCASVWHADLEAVGWMFEHEHHDAAHHQTATPDRPAGHDHSEPMAADDHDPVWARSSGQDGRTALADLLSGPGSPLVVALLLILWVAPPLALREPVPKPPPRRLEQSWCFLWRCAADAVAPPALS